MIKHGVVMVTLLILTLSLLGVVSASDVTASDVDLHMSLNHENTQIEVTNNEKLFGDAESYGSLSADGDSSSDCIESKIPIYLDSEDVGTENISSGSIDVLDTNHGRDLPLLDVLSSNGNAEGSISMCDVELLENDGNKSIPLDATSKAIDDDLNDKNYEFGQEITISTNELYDFKSADEILVILEVGENEIDNVTTENIVNGINDASNGYVTYRKGNLVKLSSIESGLINIAFFIKKGEFLTMVLYENGDIIPTYSNIVNGQGSVGLWMKLEELRSSDCASSDAKFWSDGLSKDVLSFGEHVEHDFAGLTVGQDIFQDLLDNNLNSDEPELPLDNAGGHVIGVSEDSDDNAFIWYAPDKNAYFGVDSNDDENMNGLDMEDNAFPSRMITVMSYNQSNLKEMLENNLNPDESVMCETQDVQATGEMTRNDIKQIGVDASKKALDYFKSQGIDVNKYYQNFYILTSAGHVKVNGLDTQDAIDGILEVFGYKVSKNLMSIDTPLWKDLVFYFLWVNGANGDITSYGLKYVASTTAIVESSEVKRQGDAIAYDLGLYGKHPMPPAPKHHKTHDYTEQICYPYVVGNAASQGLVNATNATNTTNSSGLNLSDVKKLDPRKVTQKPVKGHRDPNNILYNFGAICIVFFIFGASYSKR